jgi:hypothetical protein
LISKYLKGPEIKYECCWSKDRNTKQWKRADNVEIHLCMCVITFFILLGAWKVRPGAEVGVGLWMPNCSTGIFSMIIFEERIAFSQRFLGQLDSYMQRNVGPLSSSPLHILTRK